MTLSIHDLATMKNDELVARGVPPTDASRLREEYTGHRLRVGPVWANTIGAWGGVATLAEIALLADRSRENTKSYAKARGLGFRTKQLQRSPAQLAVLAFATLPGTARDAAHELRIFPVEVVLYRVALTSLMTGCCVHFHQLLDWSVEELEARWLSSRLTIVRARETGVGGGPSVLVSRSAPESPR